MTSTIIGLPDRYRPLDEVGPEESTPTGVIRCWRAKDRVLNRDVAIRVHTPSGTAAHAWITRALTAGGLANPALAMVYDASEGSDPTDDAASPGGAAYVVNEWLEGETLAERLSRGPLPERDLRPLLRRLADAVAEAHRVGLALGGLTPENIVLRPNGLVGVRAVPAANGTMEGDINALGTLLEACLRGTGDAAGALSGPPDLVALTRRARSTDPGQGISSVAAMAALLAERPRPATGARGGADDDARRRRARDRKAEPLRGGRRTTDQPARPPAPPAQAEPTRAAPPTVAVSPVEAPHPVDPDTLPPVPRTRPVPPSAAGGGPPTSPDAPGSGRKGDTVSVSVPPARETAWGDSLRTGRARDDDALDAGAAYQAFVLDDRDDDVLDELDDGPTTTGTDLPAPSARRRLLVIGLPILALVLVIGLAWWFGTNVLSVAGNIDEIEGSTPSGSTSAGASASAEESAPAAGGEPITPEKGTVFDPGGDGEPENDDQVPQSIDGDPGTAWNTLTYQGSPSFGNLKDGVGVVYDLGEERELAGITIATTMPGATVEVHAADGTEGSLDDWPKVAEGELDESTELSFDEPATTRYVLVWITGLVEGDDGFEADLAEVTLTPAG
jgi:eukaryotic-like serine/threonine-protein kinase